MLGVHQGRCAGFLSRTWVQVCDFHEKFNHARYLTDRGEILAKVRDFRVRLVKEEYGELEEATIANDIYDVIDGICDSIYVIQGTLVSFGIQNHPGHTSPRGMAYGDPCVVIMDGNMSSAYERMIKSIGNYDGMDSMLDIACTNTVVSLFNQMQMIGLPIEPFFDEVHKTNMLKIPHTEVVEGVNVSKPLKPIGWMPPDIEGIFAETCRLKKYGAYLGY